jgi:bifunctional non-homologous end joining protein LigD
LEFVVAFQRKKPAAIGVKAPYPGFIEPALATSIEQVPGGERWLHEIKFDGYRVQVQLVNEAVKVFTRRGNDWTNRFRKIADDAWHIAAGSAIIDGEVVVPAENGTTDFSVLRNELRGKSKKIVLVAFDLLYLNGYDLCRLPLIERKTDLKKIIDGTDIQFSESFEVDGPNMYAHACKVGLGGVVSKVRDSADSRGNNWVKKTCAQRETLTIAGFALDGNKWDGIYVGRRKGKDLIYAGKVDHGFDKTSAADLRKRLTPLIRKTQPYTKRIAHKGIWVEPELLAEIEYRAKLAEGKVRHPFFKGSASARGHMTRTFSVSVKETLHMLRRAPHQILSHSLSPFRRPLLTDNELPTSRSRQRAIVLRAGFAKDVFPNSCSQPTRCSSLRRWFAGRTGWRHAAPNLAQPQLHPRVSKPSPFKAFRPHQTRRKLGLHFAE